MPTLATRKDGRRIVRHFYRQFSTWQITPAGVAYLTRRGIGDEKAFSVDQFMHLWMNGDVYTGNDVPTAPRPVVLGDRDAPESLRGAVAQFYGALHRADIEAAWSFATFDRDVLEQMFKPLNSAIPAVDLVELMYRQDMPLFAQRMRSSGRWGCSSWSLRDIRRTDELFAWKVTVAIGVDRHPAGRTEVEDTWREALAGWKIVWKD